jgi:hypothetical protein
LQQSATVLGRRRAPATDCNRLQQIETPTGGKDGSQATENPVMEHTGCLPSRTRAAGRVRARGQPCRDSLDMRSRSKRGGNGSCWRTAKSSSRCGRGCSDTVRGDIGDCSAGRSPAPDGPRVGFALRPFVASLPPFVRLLCPPSRSPGYVLGVVPYSAV